jgi:hypothetical protein
MPNVPRRHPVPRPLERVPSPEPVTFNPWYDGSKCRRAPKPAKPIKPVVHPSVVSWMEEWSRRSKIRGAEERLRQEEARRLREKAYTENVYTELHLMELINEHTGNK